MEMVYKGLVVGNGFEGVVMRKRQHRAPGQFGRIWTCVEIYRHPLPCAGRGIKEREIRNVFLEFLTISLPDANTVVRLAVLPIPDVAEVRVNLTSKEERVRGRERCE